MISLKKKFLLRVVAIVVCLGFISFFVPGVIQAAENKAPKSDLKTFLKKPVRMLSSIFPIFDFFFDNGNKSDSSSTDNSNTTGKIKITGNSTAKIVSDKD